MQPAYLAAGWKCMFSGTMLGLLALAPHYRAQTFVTPQQAVETPQETNDRINSLSSRARLIPHDYVVGSGDVLSIEVFEVKELTREVRVSQTGTISLPLVPVRLHVSGLTEVQLEQKIAEVLEANGLVMHPEVSVSVKERKSKPITVVGAVPRPMVYQADRPTSLLEVLAAAGGVNADAADTAIITRPAQTPDSVNDADASAADSIAAPADKAGSDKNEPPPIGTTGGDATAPVFSTGTVAKIASEPPKIGDAPPLSNMITVNLSELMESGEAANNILLQAGDIVTVPHAGIVYVLGSVGRPGGFVLANDRTHMTTLKLLALAGGLTRTAKSNHAVIVRKDNQGKQHEVVVDLKKVLDRKTEDVRLEASDILYVPDSMAKRTLFRAGEIGLGVATGLAIYRVYR